MLKDKLKKKKKLYRNSASEKKYIRKNELRLIQKSRKR